MMLNQSEICMIMIRQRVMTQPYSKKASIPSSTIGASLSHFGHFHVISCFNLGIPSKNSLIFWNCPVLRDSTNSFISFLVESLALYISSPSQIYSIHSLISSNIFSGVGSPPVPVNFCMTSN